MLYFNVFKLLFEFLLTFSRAASGRFWDICCSWWGKEHITKFHFYVFLSLFWTAISSSELPLWPCPTHRVYLPIQTQTALFFLHSIVFTIAGSPFGTPERTFLPVFSLMVSPVFLDFFFCIGYYITIDGGVFLQVYCTPNEWNLLYQSGYFQTLFWPKNEMQ